MMRGRRQDTDNKLLKENTTSPTDVMSSSQAIHEPRASVGNVSGSNEALKPSKLL